MKIQGTSYTRLARNSQNKVYYRIYYWLGQYRIANYMYWMKVYTECSAEIITHCSCHHHCDCDAAKVKAVTITAEQRTWLKVLEQTQQFGGKFLWSHSYKNVHEYNFCNDHVIMKIMKIFYNKNLELYSIWHACSLVCVKLVVNWSKMFTNNGFLN